jgi:hypothetical protein
MSEPRDNPAVVHEESDVNVRAILATGAGLLVIGAIIHLGLALLMGAFTRTAERTPRAFPLTAEEQPAQPPEPRLQTNPRQDLRALRAREDNMLHSYGWIDRNAGVAHIPIEDAMKLTVQRGLPVRKAQP